MSHVRWIGGAPDAGKTSVAKHLAYKHHLQLYHGGYITIHARPNVWTNPDLLLFHGTQVQDVGSILSGVDLTRSRVHHDFGRGFYTTTNLVQANQWARFIADRRNGSPAVIAFMVPRNAMAELEILAFVRGDQLADDYWAFVEHCRQSIRPLLGHARNGVRNWYDVVYGPVMSNVGRRLVHPNYDQVGFHTSAAVAILDSSKKSVYNAAR